MFLAFFMPAFRIFAGRDIADVVSRHRAMHQNGVELDEMPETRRRDLGLSDGRPKRGAPPREEGRKSFDLSGFRQDL